MQMPGVFASLTPVAQPAYIENQSISTVIETFMDVHMDLDEDLVGQDSAWLMKQTDDSGVYVHDPIDGQECTTETEINASREGSQAC